MTGVFNKLVLFSLIHATSLFSQVDSVLDIRITSLVAHDYREDTMSGYRLQFDSTYFKLMPEGEYFFSSNFYRFDRIVFRDEDFEKYTFSNDSYRYISRSGILMEDLELLFYEIEKNNYQLHRDTRTIRNSDSVIASYPVEILIPKDFGLSYLGYDSIFFEKVLDLRSYNRFSKQFGSKRTINEFLNYWLNDNADFTYISYEYLLQVTINLGGGVSIVIYQRHPGDGNCKWDIEVGEEKYTVFNPRINDLIYSFMDGEFGSKKHDLLEFKKLDYLLKEGFNY